MNRIRVLIAEDSMTVRERIKEVLSDDSDFDIVGIVENGKAAVEACFRLRPTVITMDMMMPEMTGMEATEQIMGYCPTPILIVSSSVNRGELFRMYDALAAGAVDVLEKAPLDGPIDDWEKKLIAKVKMAARIRVITHPRARLNGKNISLPLETIGMVPYEKTKKHLNPRCLAIGTSTGGPAALVEIFRTLPANFPLSILLVIHIGRPFDAAFSEWLNSQSKIPVVLAKDGDVLPPFGAPPKIFMAPPDFHMEVRRDKIRLTSKPERFSCRPSVDVLFESLAQEWGADVIACLLTGMGRDGAAGLLSIKRAGGITLVQDEATSIIFGMPGEAVRLDAATQILPLEEFAPLLIAMTSASTSKGKDL